MQFTYEGHRCLVEKFGDGYVVEVEFRPNSNVFYSIRNAPMKSGTVHEAHTFINKMVNDRKIVLRS